MDQIEPGLALGLYVWHLYSKERQSLLQWFFFCVCVSTWRKKTHTHICLWISSVSVCEADKTALSCLVNFSHWYSVGQKVVPKGFKSHRRDFFFFFFLFLLTVSFCLCLQNFGVLESGSIRFLGTEKKVKSVFEHRWKNQTHG